MLPQGSGVPPDEWTALLDSLGGHFVQSRAWARFQKTQGRETLWAASGDAAWAGPPDDTGARTRGEGGPAWCWLGVVRSRRGFRDLYLPCGPAFQGVDNFDAALASALDVARSNGIDMVRIEPQDGIDAAHLRARGAVPTDPIQPQYTWLIDLSQTESELFKALNANRRRDVKTAGKKGLKTWRSHDPDDATTFTKLLGATVNRRHFNPHSDGYYRDLVRTLMPDGDVSLYFAGTGEGDPIAAILGFHTSGAAYYAHVAADQDRSRELNAPGPLAWRMILDAKQAGCRWYDFWGVTPDESPDHPWAGFSRFKRGFGGAMHRSAGTWDIAISKPKYLAYRAARRVLG